MAYTSTIASPELYLKTPCCDAPFVITCESGTGDPISIECEDCFNEWYTDGTPKEYLQEVQGKYGDTRRSIVYFDERGKVSSVVEY